MIETHTNRLHKRTIKKCVEEPWLVGSFGWSVIPYTESLRVRFLVGASMGGNQCFSLALMLLSLPTPSSLSKSQ